MAASSQRIEADRPPPTQVEEVAWITRLLRPLRPREGWLVLILAWGAVLSLPGAAIEGKVIAGLEPTIWLAILGLSCGWWLGHRRMPGPLAAGAAFLIGVVADLIWGVHALSFWSLVTQVSRWIAWRLGERLLPAPPVTYFADQWSSLSAFGQRVAWWIGGLTGGKGSGDNLVLVGLAGLLAWCVAAWAGWWITRHGRPLVALLPTGVLLAQQVYATEAGYWALLFFLTCGALLLVMARLGWLMRQWDGSAVDYSPELRYDAIAAGLAIASLTLVLAPTIPFLTSHDFSEAFWRIFREPYNKVEDRVRGSFQGTEPTRSLVPPSGVAAGGLPRAHLLGGRPELGQKIVLRITARGAREAEPLYWRGQTFASYSGRGWDEDRDEWSRNDLGAGEPWSAEPPPGGRRSVLSAVEVVEASRAVLYGAGEPISVDRPYRATTRFPGDLVALSGQRLPSRYIVLGGVLDQDEDLLRAAGTAYPPEVAQTYLQLPAGLPVALQEYAAQVTAGAVTPYDEALAIESALRQIPYSLDVPVPPEGREVVSWFLFDLRRGYCDYFATAMVVLSRLSGIPARLAVGYAPGRYDPQTGVYTVTELDAHSWPELYFPGYGWVPFEPTPAQTTPGRIMGEGGIPPWAMVPGMFGLDTGMSEMHTLAVAQTAESTRQLWISIALGALNGLLAAFLAVTWYRLLFGSDEVGLAKWFVRLARWGRRLGRPLRAADTPREYARAVSNLAETAYGRPALAEAADTVRAEAWDLATAYELDLFGPDFAEEQAEVPGQDGQRWAPLWLALRRLWLARWRI